MYVTNEQIIKVAQEMQSYFEFDLHSKSSIEAIARIAQEELAERGLPTRKSLCFVVAKNALTIWQETIHQTKQILI